MSFLVSAVVAVHNDATGITATLRALQAQTMRPADFEVIVVDDASTDDTPRAIGAFPGVRLLRLSQRAGAYVARNRGLAAATGRVIAITDADCRPAPEWLERGAARVTDHPDAVIGGHIAMPLGPRPSLAAMVDVVHHLDQGRAIEEFGYAVTANLFAARGTFSAVGEFDERLMSSGDVEWTRRAVRLGHPLLYAPDAVVLHPPRTTARALLKKARRVAEGGARARRAGTLPAERPYLNPWVLVPWNRKRGRARVLANGAAPGRFRWFAVALAQLALVQIPQAAFALTADLRLVWRDLRRARS
jgi:glycosyltransferase involved in cell wall biosynthesis